MLLSSFLSEAPRKIDHCIAYFLDCRCTRD